MGRMNVYFVVNSYATYKPEFIFQDHLTLGYLMIKL